MLQVLSSLIALQQLDTAAEAVRRRLADLPAAEQAIDREIASAAAHVERATTALAANQQARRELEKQVAAVDTRLARFEEHKAAVKTNQEFTAVLHEISTAKAEKNGVEEKILVLMEEADSLSADVTAAGQELAAARAKGEGAKTRMADERRVGETELARLGADKKAQSSAVDAPTLAKYERLLSQRKMIAVAAIQGELCTACHVRLRPHVIQQIRRNADIFSCDNCQRILYAPQATDVAGSAVPTP